MSSAPKLQRLDHWTLVAKDLERTRTFYTEVLGATVLKLGGLDQWSWVVMAYLLATTATTPLWGKISDLYGRRLIFQIAIGFFLIGSALSGLSQNMPQLIDFRAVPTAPRAASVRVWHFRSR
jgi:MFS family permease